MLRVFLGPGIGEVLTTAVNDLLLQLMQTPAAVAPLWHIKNQIRKKIHYSRNLPGPAIAEQSPVRSQGVVR